MKWIPQIKDYREMAENILDALPKLISVPIVYNRKRLNPILYELKKSRKWKKQPKKKSNG